MQRLDAAKKKYNAEYKESENMMNEVEKEIRE